MDSIYQATISSPLGKLGLRTSAERLTSIEFINTEFPMVKPQTLVAKETILQLQCYFADPTFAFDIPFELSVSPFQQSVLDELIKIPLGETRSYSEIAKALDSSPRPIGNACRHNPIPIIIPCHRVVAKSHIGGYSGDTAGTMIDIKNWLLSHEGL